MGRSDSTLEKVAELEVLERFDAKRQAAGHDYGAGQRASELSRRRNELVGLGLRAGGEDDPELTPAELLAAFDRVAGPRIKRLIAEDYRRGTPATKRTIMTWRRLSADLRAADEGRSAAGLMFSREGDVIGEKSISDRELLAPLVSDDPARYLLSDGLVEAGTRVESFVGAGQPKIVGRLVSADGRGHATVELDDGSTRRRSVGHLRRARS